MEQEVKLPQENGLSEGDSPHPAEQKGGADAVPFSAEGLSDQAAEELCTMFGCSRESLGVLLASAGSDPSGILALARSLSPAYLAIKIHFEPRRREGPGGAVCLIARGSSGEIIDETLLAGNRSLLSGIDISADWEAFRMTLRSLEGKGERDLYLGMTKIIRAVFLPTAVNRLFHGEDDERESLRTRLESEFRESMHREFIFSLSTETFNRVRLEEGGLGEEEDVPPPTAPAGETPSAPGKPGVLQIPCKPVLDPVRGRAISDLKEGDRVHVQLDSTGGISALVAKIFQRSGEATVFPVISLERLPSGQSLLRLAISPGVVGTITGGTDVRLKVSSPLPVKSKGLSPRGRAYAAALILAFLILFAFLFLWKGGN